MTDAVRLRPGFASSPGPSRARGGRPSLQGAPAVAIVIAAMCLLPVAALAAIALTTPFDGWPHLLRHVVPATLADTILLSGGAAAMSVAIGVPAAWLVTHFEFRGRRVLEWALILPLAVPTYLVAYCFVEVFEPLGPVQRAVRAVGGFETARDYWFPAVRSPGGAVVLFGLVLYPYVFVAVRAALLMRAVNADDAATVLGAGPLERLRRITLPRLWPAASAGAVLVALEALNDVGAAEYLGLRPVAVAVYTTWLNKGSLAGAAQLALLALALALFLVTLERRGQGLRLLAADGARPRPARRRSLRGARAAVAAFACALPPLLGFGVPVAFLAGEAGRILGEGVVDPLLGRQALATLRFTALGALGAVALASALVLAARWRPGPTTTTALRIGTLGYALPGTVLALGVLIPAGAFDNAAAIWARSLGWPANAWLIGSGAALVFAYGVRFVSVATAALETAGRRIPASYESAARVLGAGPWEAARRVTLPLARPALASGALLVVVDAVKELPATLLLRPFGVETFATAVYGHASRGAFEDAALHALAIVAVGLVSVALLARASRPIAETVGSR